MKQLLETLQTIGTFGLVVMGVVGIVWRTVKEDGWFSTVFMKLFNALVDNPVVMFPLLIVVAFVGKLWFDYQREKGFVSRLPSFFLYLVMAAGAYFVFNFLTTGSL